ncbi:MAG TPA: hypothetical protein VGB56_12995 [Flavisolibacter sp.]
MKYILLLSAALLLAGQPTYAQLPTPAQEPGLKEDYLRRSKQQKTTGTILVIGGGAVALVGGALWFLSPIAGLAEGGDVDGAKRTGQTMVLTGTAIGLLSIPFFISGSKNKQAAAVYTGSTELQHFPLAHGKRQVSIGLRISL